MAVAPSALSSTTTFNSSAAAISPLSTPSMRLKSAQAELLNQSKHSSLTIRCREKIWHCHRAILCPRCPFFEAACGGQLLESESREITLANSKPEYVEMFLLHLYTMDPPNFSTFSSSFRAAFQAVVLGDQCLVDSLSEAGQSFFSDKFGGLNFVKRWQDSSENFKTNMIIWTRRFFEGEQTGFKAIRPAAVDAMASLKDKLIEREDFGELLCGNKAFAIDFVKVLPDKPHELS